MYSSYHVKAFPLNLLLSRHQTPDPHEKIRTRKMSITFDPQQIEISFFQHWLPIYPSPVVGHTRICCPCSQFNRNSCSSLPFFCKPYFNLDITCTTGHSSCWLRIENHCAVRNNQSRQCISVNTCCTDWSLCFYSALNK